MTPRTFPEVLPPAGLVWPAARGREVLRRLVSAPPGLLRGDLVGQRGAYDGSGSSDLVIVERAGFCLKTSPRRRYASVEEAQRALLTLARKKSALGSLASPQTVVCVQSTDDGAHWLWTVSPWVSTLRAQMADAVARDDDASLASALVAYAQAAAHAVTLAARARLVLDVHPSNFGREGDRVVYLDDDVAEGLVVRALGHALLQRVEEYGDRGAAVEAFVEAIVSSLLEVPRSERDTAEVERAFEAAICRHPRARSAREHVLASFVAVRRAQRGA